MEILEKDFPPALFLKCITKTSQECIPDFILFSLLFLLHPDVEIDLTSLQCINIFIFVHPYFISIHR